MQLRSYAFCESVFPDSNGKVIIMNPFQMIVVNYLPTGYSFSFTFGLSNVEKKGVKGKVDLIDPNNSILNSTVIDTGELPNDFSDKVDNFAGLQLTVGYNNIQLKTAGIYTIRVLLDQFEDSFEIEVINNDHITNN